MSYWRFSDGTLVQSRAVVTGSGPLARRLRQQLMPLEYGCAPVVCLNPPQNTVELDTESDWLVWRWTLQEARSLGCDLLESDYEARLEDAPLSFQPMLVRTRGNFA